MGTIILGMIVPIRIWPCYSFSLWDVLRRVHATASTTEDSMDQRPELDSDVDDEAPVGPDITPYDEAHYVTYLRLLDADREGADWREVARIVLHRDPIAQETRSRHCWKSHLARAQWLSKAGYRRILEQAVVGRT